MASFFRRIAENWKLKTLALAIAVLLWVVWSAEEVTSNWIPVPLQIEVADSRFRAAAGDLSNVEVRFTGANRDLLDIAVRRPPLRLNISEVEGQSAEYDLNPRMIQLPTQIGVNAIDVRPRSVRVNFTRIDSKMVRVRPRVAETLTPGWALVDSVVVEPREVRITGPMDQVASVTEIVTEPIDLTSADTAFTRTVSIDTTGLAGIAFDPNRVAASGSVDRVVERIVQNVPVEAGESVVVEPARVSLRLRGPERTVRSVPPALFRVMINTEDIPADIPEEGVTVPLRVTGSRSGVRATVEPGQVTVRRVPDEAEEPPDGASAQRGVSDATSSGGV